MKDSKGRVCEYDGYVIPERGEDTAENRKLREEAMREFKKKAKELRIKRGVQSV